MVQLQLSSFSVYYDRKEHFGKLDVNRWRDEKKAPKIKRHKLFRIFCSTIERYSFSLQLNRTKFSNSLDFIRLIVQICLKMSELLLDVK